MANNYRKVFYAAGKQVYRSGGKGRKKRIKQVLIMRPAVHHLTGKKHTWGDQ